MKVKVYWNLHRKCFSVQHRGKVIMHTDDITLYDAVFKVSEAGRQRVLREKRKNVHAFIVGNLNNSYMESLETSHRVTYNPYKYDSFVFADTEESIYEADVVRCTKDGNHARIRVS